jgi:hypothetical protein
MVEPNPLTEAQIEIAHIFFALDASKGYLLAGGAALLAADLITRPTEDLDLFASTPITAVTAAKDAFLAVLRARGYDVTVLRDGTSFCRMIVGLEGNEVLVDLAIDAPPSVRPTMTALGPSLAPEELAGRKLLALFGRAEARDFADVFVLERRFGKDALLQQASALDPGFHTEVLAQMFGTIARFDDSEVPLPRSDVPVAREFFRTWAEQLR